MRTGLLTTKDRKSTKVNRKIFRSFVSFAFFVVINFFDCLRLMEK